MSSTSFSVGSVRHRTGDGPPDFVGVAGGFPPKGKGARLQELIASQSWERRPFEVQNGGSCPEHANWGTVEDFVNALGSTAIST